jgi:outer membrane protein
MIILPAYALAAQADATPGAPTKHVMTWQDCLDLARKNNADVQATESNVRALMDRERAAYNGFLPQLSADLTYNKSSTSTVGFTSSPTTGVVQSGSGYAASLSARQSLFSGLQDYAAVRQAQANVRVALATADTVRARVTYELKSAFAGLQYSKAYEQLAAQIVTRREDNLRLVQLRFESGNENKGSVLLSEAYRNQAKLDRLQASNARRVARAQLARALGFDDPNELGPLDDTFEIQGDPPLTEPPASPPDFRRLAMQTPDFRQTSAQEAAAEAALTSARSQFFPTLTVNGTAGRQGPDFFPDLNNRWSVGVALSLPFFSGGKDYYATKAAGQSLSQAASARQNSGRQTDAALELAYANYTEAVLKLQVDDSFRKATALRAEIARKKYNNGLQTFEDWDVIENDLITRQKTYLASKRDRAVAEASWEQAQGKGEFK